MKTWVNPQIISISIVETANSTQPDMDPDGVFGAIFPDGEGRECDLCS